MNSGPTVYITADTHLRGAPDEPALRGFKRLCDRAREECAPLYVLGDLFDFWVGPRQARMVGFRAVLDLLARVAEVTPVHVLKGNRDFAMGSEIQRIPGLTLHGDDIEVAWAGRRALLTHGDLLLQNDRAYQRLRRVLRSPLVRSTLRALPLVVSLRLAGALRSRSTAAVARKPGSAFEISFYRVRELFRQGGHDVIVSGHVHRPSIHTGDLSGRPRVFLTLGAWGVRGWVVCLRPDGQARLERFPGSGTVPQEQPLF